MNPKQSSARRWLWLTLLIVLLDQYTKFVAVHHLSWGASYPLSRFFNFTLNFNPGAAFGFLGGASGWQVYFFMAVSLVVAVILIVKLWRLRRTDRVLAIGISLIIGGALGNVIDRIRLKYVIDFFDFHIGQWHFDTFNIADSAVCIGAFFVILHFLFFEKRSSG